MPLINFCKFIIGD